MESALTYGNPLTVQDLSRMDEESGERYELAHGVLLVREPPNARHGTTAATIAAFLVTYVRQHRLGNVMVETGFVLTRSPDTVRAPDVSFIRAGRLRGTYVDTFVEGAPDLAVEILSPSDRFPMVEQKVGHYLAAGCRAVWVVDPREQTVTVRRPEREPVRLESHERVDGGDIVPGFRCLVAEMFEAYP